jgi:N-acyl-D-aspartate/D-glutamate deacylase
VTVFNPERVIDRSTYDSPFRYSAGIEHVIVNGRLVLDGGKPTGVKPGRGLRRGKP